MPGQPLDIEDAVSTDAGDITDDVKKRHTAKAAAAREQAGEGKFSFLRSEMRCGFEICNKNLFDQDQQERWDDLQHEMKTWDHEPDITAPDGTLIAKGALKTPYTKGGERIKFSPEAVKGNGSYDWLLAIVLWGEEGAIAANQAGVIFSEIPVIWAKQDLEMEERQAGDPKSQSGGAGLAAASR